MCRWSGRTVCACVCNVFFELLSFKGTWLLFEHALLVLCITRDFWRVKWFIKCSIF
jgi:hypothetical protein